MTIKGLTLKKSEVSQTIDLEEVYGVDFSSHPGLLERFAVAAIDYMLVRTESGRDLHNNRFAPYSKSYKESLAFQAFGKSNQVDMKLTANMLGQMGLLEVKGSKFKLGWDDPTENAKAYNHNIGDTLPKREFFGLTRRQIEYVGQEFLEEIKQIQDEQKRVEEPSEVVAGSALVLSLLRNQENQENSLVDFLLGDDDGNNSL
jgi:hypothetical protein